MGGMIVSVSQQDWEEVGEGPLGPGRLFRFRVSGVWLVLVREDIADDLSITFYPDSAHKWNP